MHDRFRYDETVKAINTGTLIQTPKSSAPAGRQYLRELVNPNIQQAAPQVSDASILNLKHVLLEADHTNEHNININNLVHFCVFVWCSGWMYLVAIPPAGRSQHTLSRKQSAPG